MSGLISSRIAPALGLVLGLLLLAPGMRAAEEATAPLSSLQVFEALYFGVETAGDDESRSEKRKLEIVFEAEDSIEDPDP